jgi:hypothetical protein
MNYIEEDFTDSEGTKYDRVPETGALKIPKCSHGNKFYINY